MLWYEHLQNSNDIWDYIKNLFQKLHIAPNSNYEMLEQINNTAITTIVTKWLLISLTITLGIIIILTIMILMNLCLTQDSIKARIAYNALCKIEINDIGNDLERLLKLWGPYIDIYLFGKNIINNNNNGDNGSNKYYSGIT